jgi:hypothetical protein
MNVTHLTIQGMFGPGSSPLTGIFFNDASGTVNNDSTGRGADRL